MLYSITFNEVALTGYKTCLCSNCGKKLKRQSKFFQTLNPYNKNEDGSVKSASEIEEELKVRIEEWKKEPEKCNRGCKNV